MSSNITSWNERATARRAASALWMGTFTLLFVASLALRSSQAAPTLEGLIAAKTGVQASAALGELRDGTGGVLSGYLEKRGTTSLFKSFERIKARTERSCRSGAIGAAECTERLREIVQQAREIERLQRLTRTEGPEAFKAKVRLGAAAYFQQVREEILPDYARANRKLFSRATGKSNRSPASATLSGGAAPTPGEQLESLGSSMTGLTGAVLGGGSEVSAQIDAVEQAMQRFTR